MNTVLSACNSLRRGDRLFLDLGSSLSASKSRRVTEDRPGVGGRVRDDQRDLDPRQQRVGVRFSFRSRTGRAENAISPEVRRRVDLRGDDHAVVGEHVDQLARFGDGGVDLRQPIGRSCRRAACSRSISDRSRSRIERRAIPFAAAPGLGRAVGRSPFGRTALDGRRRRPSGHKPARSPGSVARASRRGRSPALAGPAEQNAAKRQ